MTRPAAIPAPDERDHKSMSDARVRYGRNEYHVRHPAERTLPGSKPLVSYPACDETRKLPAIVARMPRIVNAVVNSSSDPSFVAMNARRLSPLASCVRSRSEEHTSELQSHV